MPKTMLIDAAHAEETRVVVVDGNRVEEFDFESQNRKQLRGNIYLAKVTRVEPSLQAAFVEYGGNRHGFLAFNEIHPDYYQIPVADREALMREEADDEDDEPAPRRGRGRRPAAAAVAAVTVTVVVAADAARAEKRTPKAAWRKSPSPNMPRTPRLPVTTLTPRTMAPRPMKRKAPTRTCSTCPSPR